MTARYRSAYRRYRLFRRLRWIATAFGALLGAGICYLMYENLVLSGIVIGRKEMLPLAAVMALSVTAPWAILTPLARRPSEL